MIDKIQIKNFQSHKKTELTFSPGVNCIIGKSDSGKSAVIRAMHWVINNRPAGLDIINNDSNKAEVVIESNNNTVSRIRDRKSNNKYIVNKSELKAMSLSVPEEVNAALNMADINIQYQMDKPFLLSETPGEIARIFNRIIDLDIIDRAFAAAESDRRKLNAQIKFISAEISTHKNNLKKYRILPRMEVEVNALSELNDKINQSINKIDLLETSIISIRECRDKIKKITALTKLRTKVYDLDKIANHVSGLESRLSGLSELSDNYISTYRKLRFHKITLSAESLLNKVIEKQKKIQDLQKHQKELELTISDYYKAKDIKHKYRIVDINIKKYELFEKELETRTDKLNIITEYVGQSHGIFTKIKQIKLELSDLEYEITKKLPNDCNISDCPFLSVGGKK